MLRKRHIYKNEEGENEAMTIINYNG